MSTSNSSLHKARWRAAAQWIQATATFCILALLYSSRNLFAEESGQTSAPETPPVDFVQKQYWNEDFDYGFRGESDDKYQNKVMSGADFVAVDSREGVIFEDAKVKVSYYPSHTIEEIEAKSAVVAPRAYTQLSHGIAVVEGDLDSASAKTILATLHTR